MRRNVFVKYPKMGVKAMGKLIFSKLAIEKKKVEYLTFCGVKQISLR